MSHFTQIKSIILLAEPTATIKLLSSGKIENEARALENSPFIYLLLNNSTEEIQKNIGSKLITSARFQWAFLLPDDWDNLDNDPNSTQVPDSTDEIIEKMRLFATQVFYYWSNSAQTIFTGAYDARPRWTITPNIRRYSSTMSGVNVDLRFSYYNSDVCLIPAGD